MWRWLFFLVGLCVVVVAVVWFVQNPGDVTMEWKGWRLDTSVGVLMIALVLIAFTAALTYRFWRFLRRAPGEIGSALRNRRQQKGYNALSSGMVAVAAGDAAEARRNARRAEALLSSSAPLTRLLSAQSAQLDGDEKAAERFFSEMLEDSETKFLGLRGLLTQALKAGDQKRALELANQAIALQPKSEWVSKTLFDLQSASGAWIEAAGTNERMSRNRLIEKPESQRRRAVIDFELARANPDDGAKLKQLKSANDLAPDFIPAVVALAEAYIAANQKKKATALLDKTWQRTPHPDLVAPYWQASNASEGLACIKATERLIAKNKDHIESNIAMAQASLGAELWGEARKYLSNAGAGNGLEPQARICRLMAELEERENGDLAKAREWLVRAGHAPSDAKWVCDDCGNAVEVWTAHCANCEAFDSFSWGEPPHKSAALPRPEGDPSGTDAPAALAAPETSTAVSPQTGQ